MNRIFFLFIFLLSIHVFPIEKIILKESESINFLYKMEKNEVFATYIKAVDVDDKNDFYLLDYKLGAVLRVDGKSGRLINTISSRGQGPGELSGPCALRVRNQRRLGGQSRMPLRRAKSIVNKGFRSTGRGEPCVRLCFAVPRNLYHICNCMSASFQANTKFRPSPYKALKKSDISFFPHFLAAFGTVPFFFSTFKKKALHLDL